MKAFLIPACFKILTLLLISSGLHGQDNFRIATYNVASGAGGEWRNEPIRFEAIAAHILQYDPDVVVLQEVQDKFPGGRSPNISQPQLWKRLLRMEGHYIYDYKAFAWGVQVGTAGNMVLSKWPIVAVNDDLRAPTSSGPLGLTGIFLQKFEDNKTSAVVSIRGRRIRVGSLHTGGSAKVVNYLNWLESFPEPVILAGDANAEWEYLNGPDPGYRLAAAKYVTVPNAGSPNRCGGIDWIMVQRGILKFEGSGNHGRVNGNCASFADRLSDHPLVYGTVSFEPVPVSNPGFEKTFDGWQNYAPAGSSYRAIPILAGRSGNFGAVQTGGAGILYRDLAGLIPGQRYELSAWFRANSGSNVKLTAHNTQGGGYVETNPRSGGNQWMRTQLVFVADAYRSVRVHLVRNGSDSAPVYWDDLAVTPVESPAFPDPGSYYRLFAVHSGKALDLYENSCRNGQKIVQWHLDSSGDNQLWNFQPTGRGTFTIANKAANVNQDVNRVLDIEGGPSAVANGTPLVQWDRIPNSPNQEFRVELLETGAYRIVAAHSGRVLDVEAKSSADGARIIQWDWIGADNANQLWMIEPTPFIKPEAGTNKQCQ